MLSFISFTGPFVIFDGVSWRSWGGSHESEGAGTMSHHPTQGSEYDILTNH